MTTRQAMLLDAQAASRLCKDTGHYSVFGDKTGFCYSAHLLSQDAADAAAYLTLQMDFLQNITDHRFGDIITPEHGAYVYRAI
jgi:hypothetical protein